jgi:ABC-2 type transport system ATP-binding protein
VTAIDVRHLRKTFAVYRRGDWLRRRRTMVTAVEDVSLAVAAGEMVGYIGPNGAGKSTTIKMLTGILVPSSGTVRVAGLEPSRRRIELARRIGVVFGNRSLLWWDLPLRESFDLLRHIYRVPATTHRQRLEGLVQLLDMASFLATPVRQLSLGQRMRGELTAALLHGPEVLFLDEPTVGLDIVSKARVREFLARLNREQGVTVLLTTHDLADIERLCPRMVIIDHGRVLYDGGTAEIASRFGGERTMVVDLAEALPPLRLRGAVVTRTDGPRQWIRFRGETTTAAELVAAVAGQAPLVDLSIEEPDIEDVVRRIYTGEAVAGRTAESSGVQVPQAGSRHGAPEGACSENR